MTSIAQIYISPSASLIQATEGDWNARIGPSGGDPNGTIVLTQIGPHCVPGLAVNAPPILTPTDISNAALSTGAQSVDINLTPTGSTIVSQINTLFAVYWEFNSALPGTLVASTVMPTRVNGVYQLNSSGQGLKAFFLGWFFTDGAGKFWDTSTQRLVVNYYNRRPSLLALAPGYNNNNAKTTFSLTAASWARIAAGTGDTAEYICTGEDAIHAVASYTLGAAAPAAIVQVGIGDNSNTTPSAIATIASSAASGTSACVPLSISPSVAAHRTLTMLGYTANLATTFEADDARNGSASDPQATGLYALVPT